MSAAADNLQEKLLKEGVLTKERLSEVIQQAEKTKSTLFDVLVQTGKYDEKKLVQVIKSYGYAEVDPTTFIVEDHIKKYIPKAMAEKYLAIPLSFHDKVLTVAFANPTNMKVIDEIRLVTGIRLKAVVAEPSSIRKCIEKYYSDSKNPSSLIQSLEDQHLDNLDDLVKMMEEEKGDGNVNSSEELAKAHETPIIKLVNMIMAEGIRRKASDIFVEPWENKVRVRVRVDGMLEEVLQAQKSASAPLISRIKILSELNIAERRVPQDGRFKVKINSKEIDIRVSVLPTVHGEKVCLRILDTSNQAQDLSKLGFTDKEMLIVKDAARKPHGMILVTGPTGSGKTTTLYSILHYLANPHVNITTVEDPVEYQVMGINQVNVRETIGLNFPAALRSILRQDPDIVLIGEIRDNETLDIAVKAALTGHLVLSTLHTNDAASTITRMMNMGLEPFLIVSTVLMISAQRLIRRICQRCKTQVTPDPALLETLAYKPPAGAVFYKGRGCAQCRQSGFKGRTVITEILEMTKPVRDLIMQQAGAEAVKNLARKTVGFTTLRESALNKAMIGETTLEEVVRVTNEDDEDPKISKPQISKPKEKAA